MMSGRFVSFAMHLIFRFGRSGARLATVAAVLVSDEMTALGAGLSATC